MTKKEKDKLLTFPSITETHELVVPKSMPITSLPGGLELYDQQINTLATIRVLRQSKVEKEIEVPKRSGQGCPFTN